jgi:hypothetical protein
MAQTFERTYYRRVFPETAIAPKFFRVRLGMTFHYGPGTNHWKEIAVDAQSTAIENGDVDLDEVTRAEVALGTGINGSQ